MSKVDLLAVLIFKWSSSVTSFSSGLIDFLMYKFTFWAFHVYVWLKAEVQKVILNLGEQGPFSSCSAASIIIHHLYHDMDMILWGLTKSYVINSSVQHESHIYYIQKLCIDFVTSANLTTAQLCVIYIYIQSWAYIYWILYDQTTFTYYGLVL